MDLSRGSQVQSQTRLDEELDQVHQRIQREVVGEKQEGCLEERSAFDELPVEAVLGVLSHLDAGSLARLCSVNRRMHALCQQDALWRALYQRRFHRQHRIDEALPWCDNYRLAIEERLIHKFCAIRDEDEQIARELLSACLLRRGGNAQALDSLKQRLCETKTLLKAKKDEILCLNPHWKPVPVQKQRLLHITPH